MRIEIQDPEFWKSVVDKSLAAIYITDENGKVIYVNDVVERATEFSKEEIYSLNSVFELAHPEDRKRLVQEFYKMSQTGTPSFYEARYITKSGKEKWVWGFVLSVTFKGRKLYIGNWIDVTRVKKLEQSIKESEEFYRTLVEESLTPIYLLQDGEMVYINKAFEEVTGYKKEEIVGKSPFFLIHPEDREIVYKRYVEREKGFRPIESYSWRIITKSGETKWVSARPGRVTYKGRPAVAATTIDITELHRLNEELKKRGEFLAILNRALRHDITNAITAVKGALEVIRESPENADRLITLVQKKTDYVIKLINDTRELEKSLEELKPMDLAEVVKEVIDYYKETEIDLELEKTSVLANEGLKTVINNIIHNALTHGGDGVKVKVETFSDGKYGIIRISDNGKGVPDNLKNKIFEEGFTTGEGTGLGLYIAKRIVDSYGGKIEVKDNKPKGAVFEIKIPKIKMEDLKP